jgi:hypothetical protein
MHIPTETGEWVSEHYERLARVVQDYDPQFELRWIPVAARVDPEDRKKPYVIWDLVSNTPVFFASELDTPEDILTRLFMSDNTKGNVLERIEAHNAAIMAMNMKEDLDRREEQMDKVAFLIGTEKNYINLGGGRKVDDQLRPIL